MRKYANKKARPISFEIGQFKLKSDIACGVNAVSVYMNLEVKMRSGGNSGIAGKGDKLTRRDPVAYRYDVLTVMSVASLNSVTVIDG